MDDIASILITSFKRPLHLQFGLESISRQGFGRDVEVIVLNDWLPDETEEICKRFSDALNIRYVFTGHRNFTGSIWRVPGFALNIGAKICNGRYIFLTCAEIYHLGNTVDLMLSELAKNDRALTTCAGKTDSGNMFAKLQQSKPIIKEDLKGTADLFMFLPYFMGMHKDRFMEIGGYDEDFIGIAAEDNDLYERLILNKCVLVNVPSMVVHLFHEPLLRFPLDKETEKRLAFNVNLWTERKGIIIRNKAGWGFLDNRGK